tara:strand:- start:54 stop:335 length:282 start_codon:yes stop_codon:yes gene_type:complete
MTKLCPRGKKAAKAKFSVYPSAYANSYASKICAGKIKDPSGVKRKDFKGPKPVKTGDLISTYKGHEVTKSPLQGDYGVNKSAQLYYKDLLKMS